MTCIARVPKFAQYSNKDLDKLKDHQPTINGHIFQCKE